MTADLVIDRLNSDLDRSAFDCGVEDLNLYFRNRVTQDERRRFAKCYVIRTTESAAVAGFYTLSATSFEFARLPELLSRKLPRYPNVPAMMIGRLAVDRRFAGRGLGKWMLVDAVSRCLRSEAGIYALRVDAKDETAAAFYARFGFIGLPSAPLSMFIPLATVEASLVALP